MSILKPLSEQKPDAPEPAGRKDEARKETTQLQIEGTNALAESAHLQKALEAVPGVQSVRVETHEGRITIEHAHRHPVE